MPLWFNLLAVCIDDAEAVLAALLLRRLLPNPFRFDTVRQFGWYCLSAVLLAPALLALPGAWSVQLLGFESLQKGWQDWFLGSAMANLMVTPVLFYWVMSPPDLRKFSRAQRIEALALLCGLALSLQQAFASTGNAGFIDGRIYAPIAFLVWAAIRFGVLGASAAIALLTAFAVGAAFSGHDPFVGNTPLAMAADMQHFLLLRAAPIYLAGVLTDAGRHAAASLRESERRFRTLADTARFHMDDRSRRPRRVRQQGLARLHRQQPRRGARHGLGSAHAPCRPADERGGLASGLIQALPV